MVVKNKCKFLQTVSGYNKDMLGPQRRNAPKTQLDPSTQVKPFFLVRRLLSSEIAFLIFIFQTTLPFVIYV